MKNKKNIRYINLLNLSARDEFDVKIENDKIVYVKYLKSKNMEKLRKHKSKK